MGCDNGKNCKGSCDTPASGDIQFFKSQVRIYPKSVKGLFRRAKWAIVAICLGIYYFVPFLRWDRGPNAPDQAVLIDMDKGRAYWFWFEIWPQEVYILTGILICAAIGLFFVTSLLGRVWCGFFCFQTVWTDLFIKVEELIQGDSFQRKKLAEGPWNFQKIYKLGLTHALWILIAFATGGAFVLYFNDAPTLIHHALNLDVSPKVMGFVFGLTASTYIMAGFAREQVCTFMCPYARFQSAMFDKDTLIIGYDDIRGEPRGKHKKGEDWSNLGDCTDCSACVQVCPMGIDIRHGLQMQCIACGLCIDACDEVMDKLGLPRGLIAYDTEHRKAHRLQGIVEGFRIFRPRTFYYMIVLTVVGSIMLYGLIHRDPLKLSVLHDRNPLFVQLSGGEIRNGYDIKILNKTHEHRYYKLVVEGLEGVSVKVNGAGDVTEDHIYVPADTVGHYKVFVESQILPQPPKDIYFKLTDKDTQNTVTYETMFISERPKE